MDQVALAELGRAFAETAHDIKNRLGGLKLYATFLRKKLAQSERPVDELEALDKLIAGLDGAAEELAYVVRYARPVTLQTRAEIDLVQLVSCIGSECGHVIVCESDECRGQFDGLALSEALRALWAGARESQLKIRLKRDGAGAVIEWQDAASESHLASIRRMYGERIVCAHGGRVERKSALVRVSLPLGS